MPTSSFNLNLNVTDDIQLADDGFFQSKRIDVLLGASMFFDILRDGRFKLGKDLPTLQNSVFGLIASGKIASNHALQKTSLALTTTCNT